MKIRTLLIAIIFMFACSENVQEVQDSEIKSNLIQPFKNIAKEAFGGDFFIENRYPGVAVFDFDRDEDLDLYFTSSGVSSLLEETRGGRQMIKTHTVNRFIRKASSLLWHTPVTAASALVS